MKTISVLFVCMGNICRSPTAHGVMRHKVQEAGLEQSIFIESAGTHAYHVGEAPDERSIKTASNYGIDLRDLRALQVKASDFDHYDYIFAMDEENLLRLKALQNQSQGKAKLMKLLELTHGGDVPDPYYGGAQGFENVFAMVDEVCEVLLTKLKDEIN